MDAIFRRIALAADRVVVAVVILVAVLGRVGGLRISR